MVLPMSSAPALLALVACVSLCCLVSGHLGEQQSDEITLEHEQIFVNFENGTTFSLMIEPDDSMQNLWCDIDEHVGVPGHRMRLQVGETRLNLTANLSDYNIRAGTKVALVMSESEGKYTTEFTVRTREGRELPVSTPLDITVASLKDYVTQQTGITQAEQRLLLRGKELKDERKLISYRVDNGTKISLGAPLEDCRQVATIFVKTPSGASFEVVVSLADTVTDLKEKIWEKKGVPVGVQRLFANERSIIGEDHLCDLGLEAGSTVYMFLYSLHITSPDQVAKLREPPVECPVRPYRAPIFREVEDVGEAVQSGRRRAISLYKDARNWVTRRGWAPNRDLIDPVAYLKPNPDHEMFIEQYRRILEALSHPNASHVDRREALVTRAQIALSLAVRPHRVAANITWVKNDAKHNPGITLGGGSTDVNSEQLVPLGADVNNWAPDAFSDSDLIRLFEVAERVRRLLARASQTGEGILSIANQKRINHVILLTYLEALAGFSPPVVYGQPREDEECGICRDDLRAELSVKLTCEHTFHADCILQWVSTLYMGVCCKLKKFFSATIYFYKTRLK